ncbi:16S rRNA (cytosine(1402)-N(4))-methyltransferase RsmH [Pajaroellobacter abortibovis]|uniref:Ribosomal RNA small subunit methyltransferase H n=1 Tax=Pajaroellobacter abortibovis TaxID=1882918 RepID=A0A1L6MZ84_9BACT|nr:16S rRNA (cytosine(1402)-N(4))-methyltransferase RsmH [Pajaroellobacter abortibovis]APS00853.1 16S rRNA (cytosine(1402)-N(4))-methyltransferase [Pajaroellobacter abortibovis]
MKTEFLHPSQSVAVPGFHESVMTEAVVRLLSPQQGGVYVDVTLGGGGHAEAILKAEKNNFLVGFDRDPFALQMAKVRLAPFSDRTLYINASFGQCREQLKCHGIGRVQGLCADLGINSSQLNDAKRGMSFRQEGPLDMRMDLREGLTARELILHTSEEELASLLFHYGGEWRSRRIACRIKEAVEEDRLHTTLDLRRAVVRAVGPARVGGIDPATRTFQALRIAVNRELEELETLLSLLDQIVGEGGIAVFISFHSLEDRQVKLAFKKRPWETMTKKPLVPTQQEIQRNPRARSAKLRAAHHVPKG